LQSHKTRFNGRQLCEVNPEFCVWSRVQREGKQIDHKWEKGKDVFQVCIYGIESFF
jgi:hypothetical protein